MRVADGGGSGVPPEHPKNYEDAKNGWCGNRWYDNGIGGVIGHLGVPGAGKTFLAGHTLARCSRVVAFDTADAWGSGERLNPLPGGGWLELDSTSDLADFWRENRRNPFRILFKPHDDPERRYQQFMHVCRLVRVVRDVVLGVDEVWEFCDADNIPGDFERILLRGRTPGVTVVWAAQFPATISRRLTGASTEMRIFRITEESDLNSPALKSKVGKEVRALLPNLRDRQFVRWFHDRPFELCTTDRRGNVIPV